MSKNMPEGSKKAVIIIGPDEFSKHYAEKLGNFPLYAFLLYSELNENVAEFISKKGQWLHCLTNEDCLVGVFENPSAWGERWKNYWRERLAPDDFEIMIEKNMMLSASDRNYAYILADSLEVDKQFLPCFVFVEDFGSKKVLHIPLVVNETDYPAYFQELFSCVHKAVKAPKGKRLESLQAEYRIIWAKWILPNKVKNWAKKIQEWGSVIKDTKDVIGQIVDPVSPFMKGLFPEKSKAE
jgi:hypothetical protein